MSHYFITLQNYSAHWKKKKKMPHFWETKAAQDPREKNTSQQPTTPNIFASFASIL